MALTHGCASTPIPVEPTLEDKLARLLKLEDERSLGGGEVHERLRDPAGRVRAAAALSLGRLGDSEAAASIAPLLRDPTPFVRQAAAFSLGLLEGELPADAVLALSEALGDEEESVRARAHEALGKKGGPETAELIATAIGPSVPRGSEPYAWADAIGASALTYSHHDLRLAIFALARLDQLRWSWDILATEGETPRFEWWPAAWALSELSGDERAPLLAYYAGMRNPEFRLWAARGLRGLTRKPSWERVRVLLADPNERVRIAAVRAAASLGVSEAVPDLLSMLERDTRYVQAEILVALSVLPAPAAVEVLLNRLGSESGWIRALVLPALARQDPDGFWLILAGLGSDPDWQARAALADLLARLTGERALERLRSMAEPSVEADARVRASALKALARRDPERVATFLVQRLSADDPFERLAAAEALETIGATDGVAPVKRAFLVESSGEPTVKPRFLDVLVALDPESGRSTASAALGDPDYLVRRRAASILKRSGETGVAIEPRPSELGLDAYRPYVSPLYSPQAFVETERGVIEIELFVLDAPLTVRNFVRLAREGFYDGLSVHHVVPNGYIQAGDPRGDGNGGPGYVIRSELNGRPIVRGSVAMMDHGRDTAGSQFFITHLPRPDLDGRYTVFGQVTSGLDVVDRSEPGDTILSVTIWDGFTSPYRDAN
jgi:cyclophilin family peptidyl-prolyl cis-trans isomerase/HEAT repeat protein